MDNNMNTTSKEKSSSSKKSSGFAAFSKSKFANNHKFPTNNYKVDSHDCDDDFFVEEVMEIGVDSPCRKKM